MRSEAEIVQAWWDAKEAGHPRPLASFLIEDIIKDALAQLKPEIEKLIAEQFLGPEGEWAIERTFGKVEKRPLVVVEGPPSDLYDANPGGER